MYSDNDFEDAGYDAPLPTHGQGHDQHQNYEFDINSAFNLTGEAYDLDSSALLQTVGRGSSPMYSYGLRGSLGGGIGGGGGSEMQQPAFAVDEDGEELAVGNANLGSPQPSTIKKLKSHLDGVGMGGGYLTSPMGMMRKGGAVATGYSVQMNQVGGSGEQTLNTSPTKSSPLKPLQHPPQQGQQSLQSYQQQQQSVFQPLQPLQPYQQRRHEPQQQQPYQHQAIQMQPSYSQPSYQQQTQQDMPMQAGPSQHPQQPQSQPQWHYSSAPLAPCVTSTPMSRLQSAPAAMSFPPMPAPAPAVQPATEAPPTAARPATAAAAGTTKRKAASRKASSSKLKQQPQPTSSNIGLGIPGAAFSELDYGCMRIYGRPLARSASPNADAASAPLPGNGGAAFLPYPEHLPTVTLGRGLKHVHDVDAPVSHLSFPPVPVPSRDEEAQLTSTCQPSDEDEEDDSEGEEELPTTAAAPISAKAPVMKQSNLNKPFIQYVPPNSPAAKAAAARNRNKLSINTAAGSAGDSSKLVPIRMSPSKRDMPLTPPITASSTMSSRSPHRLASPAKAAAPAATGYGAYSTAGLQPLAPPPAFEFNLENYESYGLDSAQVTNGNHHDFAAALGLPRTPGLESCSSAGSVSSSSGAGGARNGGRSEYLSPGPLSTTSTYSSVFSSVTDEMASLFPGPNSPSFFDPAEPSSIDQALASLLEGNALHSAQHHQHSMQHQQDSAYQQQMQTNAARFPDQFGHLAHNLVSPPHSPNPRGGTSNTPSPSHQQTHHPWTWEPPSNQSESAGISQRTDSSNIDPALREISQSTVGSHALLSPHSQQMASFYGSPQQRYPPQISQYGELSQSGRPISSPRRLQGMRSAPDLGAMYQQQQQSTSPNFAELLHSPTPRKASLKRGRDAYASEYEDEDEEEDDGGDENGNGQYQQGVYLEQQPPTKKRSVSVGLNTLAQSPNPSLSGTSPGRLRPGPKPKTSLPNLQAARQSVFVVAANAPPVPHLPMTYGSAGMASGSVSSQSQSALSPSPDPEAACLAALQLQQAGLSKDTLASFYSISTGDRQTKKGRPQRVYICAIPGCLKEVPRKSAVKSHIQTHLEDKPFACPYDDCGASFVRSHDLTRHVRIHSGSKPFECACGKGFARGDALTRHRQRGICEGSLVPRRW